MCNCKNYFFPFNPRLQLVLSTFSYIFLSLIEVKPFCFFRTKIFRLLSSFSSIFSNCAAYECWTRTDSILDNHLSSRPLQLATLGLSLRNIVYSLILFLIGDFNGGLTKKNSRERERERVKLTKLLFSLVSDVFLFCFHYFLYVIFLPCPLIPCLVFEFPSSVVVIWLQGRLVLAKLFLSAAFCCLVHFLCHANH